MSTLILIVIGIFLILLNVEFTPPSSIDYSKMFDSTKDFAISIGYFTGSNLLGIIGAILIIIGYFTKSKTKKSAIDDLLSDEEMKLSDEKEIEIMSSKEYIDSLNENTKDLKS